MQFDMIFKELSLIQTEDKNKKPNGKKKLRSNAASFKAEEYCYFDNSSMVQYEAQEESEVIYSLYQETDQTQVGNYKNYFSFNDHLPSQKLTYQAEDQNYPQDKQDYIDQNLTDEVDMQESKHDWSTNETKLKINRKPLRYYQSKKPWRRGTKIILNYTTKLHQLLEMLSFNNKCELIPQIINTMLENEDVARDAVLIFIQRIWTQPQYHRIYAEICYKAFQSNEYGMPLQVFQNGIIKKLKYSFFTLKFEVDRKEEFLSWKNRVIRNSRFIGILFLNNTFPISQLDNFFAHCIERILLSQIRQVKELRLSISETWISSICTLLGIVGYKLATNTVNMRDEIVQEALINYIEDVQLGILGSIQVSIPLFIQFFNYLRENFELTEQSINYIDSILKQNETNWTKKPFLTDEPKQYE